MEIHYNGSKLEYTQGK